MAAQGVRLNAFGHEFDANAAVLSPCGRYRYSLTRRVNEQRHTWCVFVMLNPSTADATTDDPTIRACCEFARRWECGWLQVVNLYAFRSTDPKGLDAAEDPIGPDNVHHVDTALANADVIVCAWGAHAGPRGTREGARLRDLYPVHHLGLNADGSPKHPLYIKRSTLPTLWEVSP